MRSLTITSQNGSIHILEAAPITKLKSEPMPVVFIHGMACSANIWEQQLAYTSQTRRAIAMDLRGHGASDPPKDDDYSPDSCADDLFAVLDNFKLEQIVLIGHSFGSLVAIAAAAAKPNRIAKLILVDPPIDCTQCPPEVYEAQIAPMQAALATDDWRSTLEASFRNALEGSKAATQEQILTRFANTPKDRLIGTSRELFTFKAVEALDRYLATTRSIVYAILAPSNNLPFSLHVLRPAISTITIPATGHWLMLDEPEAFATGIDTCLSLV
jgi:pimeloyl-ACP methyl ester carboxylesterase